MTRKQRRLILIGSGNSVMGHFAGTVAALLRTREEEKRFTITEYTPPSAHRHHQLADALFERDEDAAYRWSYATIEATLAEFIQESDSAGLGRGARAQSRASRSMSSRNSLDT